MDLRCLLVDDEPHALDLLTAFIGRTPGLCVSGSFTEPAAAIDQAHRQPLAFLDIDMPGMNGLDLAARLPRQTTVIYTTSYRQYAADAYELAAADYLLKPFPYERFLTCVNRIISSRKMIPAVFFVRDVSQGQTVRVDLSALLYVSAALNYLELHLQDGRLRVYARLTEFEKRLPETFLRVHRSYIVNRQHIAYLAGHALAVSDGTIIPIGRRYRTAVKASGDLPAT